MRRGPKRTLTVDEAAELAGVSRQTVYAWIKSGLVVSVKGRGSVRVVYASLLARLRWRRSPSRPA